MLKCPFCQFDNEDGALFCERCKSDLNGAEPAKSAAAAPSAVVVGTAMEAVPLTAAALASGAIAAVAVDATPVAEAIPVAEIAALSASPSAVAVASAETETLTLTPPAEVPPSPSAAELTDTEQVTPAAEVPSDRLPPGAKPKLLVVRGQRVNAEYSIYEGDNYIGRADDKAVDIDLEDQEPPDRIWSSRQHALLTFEDGKLVIEDLSSTNGTFVNRVRIHPGQKRSLQANDIVQIGTVQLRVKI